MRTTPIRIMSVNMRRRSAITHALLQNSPVDILLIQEPWHGKVQTARSDSSPEGIEVRGATYNNQWDVFLPSLKPGDTCRVATYIRSSLSASATIFNQLTHPCASPSSLITDLVFPTETLRVVNVYHQVPERGHALHHLLSNHFDDAVPTLMMGDFNTHSARWSFPFATISSWSRDLEDWFSDQGLHLINTPRVATWQGRDEQHPSVLDLALLNDVALFNDQFSSLSVSFTDSLGSDHAALNISWVPTTAIPLTSPSPLPGFKIVDELRDSWIRRFRLSPTPSIYDIPSLDDAAKQLHIDIDNASHALFQARQTPDPRGVRWWNTECSAALTALTTATGAARRTATNALRATILAAKRQWAQDFLDCTDPNNLWQAVRWTKRRHQSRIPPIMTDSGPSQTPSEMVEAFSSRFFSANRLPVSPSQPDDPDPLPPRPFERISAEEIKAALSTSSNKSAPGPSGITYKLLKWAFEARPDRFVELFNAALTLGHHPWKEAKVVVIPKPSKPDYSLPKAYRPISLLECCGKLLEKVVAKRLLSDINCLSLIPSSQFGSRDYSCATDAALSLVHTIQGAIQTRHACAIIMFDIQGFFDHISIERAVHIMANCGFPPTLCAWVRSFLSNRRVSLSFNNYTSDPFELDHGTPQGSPLSPILSAIYTSPLLHLTNRSWIHKGLKMYVDDGGIQGTSITHREAAKAVARGYEDVVQWLHRNGLTVDKDKTEFISFSPRHSTHLGARVPRLGLRDPVHGEYAVAASKHVRYLGIFIQNDLGWTTHVRTMAARARSTVHALSVLGNSIRGISFANWRKVFHSLILPVLTYGLPVWFTDRRQASLIQILQVAQNDAVRKISGCFHTTPVAPLHSLLSIPPIRFTLRKIRANYSDRIYRLPPTSLLRTLPSHNPIAYWPSFVNPTTNLTSLLPTSHFPPFSFPAHPSKTSWSHPRLTDLTSVKPRDCIPPTHDILRKPPANSLSLFIHPMSVDSDLSFYAYYIFRENSLVNGGWCFDGDRTLALFKALSSGIACLFAGPTTYILASSLFFFLPNSVASSYIPRLDKHRYLPFSTSFSILLPRLLDASPLRTIQLRRFSPKWARLPGEDVVRDLTARAQNQTANLPPIPASNKAKVFQEWLAEYITQRHHGEAWVSCQPPHDTTPPPFILGSLSAGNRRLFSTSIQLTTRHAFDANYSMNFRPQAGDNTLCPCDTTWELRAANPTDDLLPPTNYTIAHVITECPLFTDQRLAAFGTRSPSLPFLFSTERGGRQLVDFLHATQALLRPLPPRPDPP